MNSSLLVFSRHCCQEGIWTEELQIFSVLFNKYFSSLKRPVWPQPRVGEGEAEEPPSEGGVTHPGDAGGAGDRGRGVGALQHRGHEGGPGGEPLLVQLLMLVIKTSIVRSKLFSLLRARHPECLSRQYHRYAKYWANDQLLKVTDQTAPRRCGDCGRPPSARGGFIATIKYLYYCPGFFDPRGRCTDWD